MPMKKMNVATMNRRRPRPPGNCGRQRGTTIAERSAKAMKASATNRSPSLCPVESAKSTGREASRRGSPRPCESAVARAQRPPREVAQADDADRALVADDGEVPEAVLEHHVHRL